MKLRRPSAFAICAALVGLASLCQAHAYKFPIENADDAISVAKKICIAHGGPLMDEDDIETSIKKAMPTLQWAANREGDYWYVDTEPSVLAGTNEHLLTVDLPVNGPAPKMCREAGYDYPGATPPPKPPRGPCDPSDISAPDAQELAIEVVEPPERGVWLEVPVPESRKKYWAVTVRNRNHDEWHFKVFKRTAEVLNVKTGEFFTSLPSKAQYVEHHCLDKRWRR